MRMQSDRLKDYGHGGWYSFGVAVKRGVIHDLRQKEWRILDNVPAVALVFACVLGEDYH